MTGFRVAAAALALSFGSLACDAPPRGEALIVIDTDMPVPKIVDTLQVDIYSPDGSTWWVSRNIYLPDPGAWPVSFSVYSDDTSVGSSALVRLRGYRSEYVEDYRGEGALSLPPLGSQWTAVTAGQCCTADCTSLCPQYWNPPQAALPRLQDTMGEDVTPAVEPQPLVTIDQLVLVNLVPGMRGKVSVLLAGACAGTQAVLPDPSRASPQPSDIQTCIDTERTLVPVAASTLDPDMTLPAPGSTVEGQFEAPFATDCPNTPRTPTSGLFDDEVCVHGGVMVFGSATGEASIASPSVPRIAAVPSFLMDKYEYSVARFEKAYGMLAQVANYNNGPSNDPSQTAYPLNCTGYDQPDPSWATADRDAEPLNCVQWTGARKLCQLEGGDVPTEVQWEYAESAAGRPSKSFLTFQQPLSCAEVSYGRDVVNGANECYMMNAAFFGAARVDYGMDVADVLDGGILGMTGNVAEYALDAGVSMAANCWLSAPIESPSCVQPASATFIMRATSWDLSSDEVSAAWRVPVTYDDVETSNGFRCVR
jgi:formylglycine-generating enzyme required for sulfatase activity